MESRHRSRIVGEFRDALADTPLHVLDIPDDYEFMDAELVDLLDDAVSRHLRDVAGD